jgi:hypothetical protein
MHQFGNLSLESNSMFSSKAFNNLHFDTGLRYLMIDKVLDTFSSLTSHIDLRNSLKPSVEGQNTSILNSELEYNIYSATLEIRELSNTYLKPQAII